MYKTLEDCIITTEEEDALTRLVQKCYNQARIMGWHDNPIEDGTRIALMHSELSEALEGLRKNKMDDHLHNRSAVEVELADCVIRIFDYCGLNNLDIGAALREKILYNQTRLDHQKENRNQVGGKKF